MLVYSKDTSAALGSASWFWSYRKKLIIKCVCVTQMWHLMQVLCIAGNCHKVDVCANFNYKAFSLTLA